MQAKWEDVQPDDGKELTIEQIKELRVRYPDDPVLTSLLFFKLSGDPARPLEDASELYDGRCIVDSAEEEPETGLTATCQPRIPLKGVVHVGYVCDMCKDSPILGLRHKCTKHADFDLCHACYEQKLHGDHPLVTIPSQKWLISHHVDLSEIKQV